MSKQPRMTAQDKAWQAKSDATTLAEAETIKGTPSRLRPARRAAREMAAEAEKRARGMKKVAAGKGPVKRSRRR